MESRNFDVIIIGGSYSGLAAGMALGRALKSALIVDGGNPCNKQTPYSHNFLTQDGKSPREIAMVGKQQLQRYKTVEFLNALATTGRKTEDGFQIQVASGETFKTNKLIFATGIKDVIPNIEGSFECWGVSLLHCPYCHGYEVRNEKTGVLGNGEPGYELAKLISNWTSDLTLFTNGFSTLTPEQRRKLEKHDIKIVEKGIERLDHQNGYLQNVVFNDGSKSSLTAIYSRNSFEQQCKIPESLGCELTEDGYLKVDAFLETTVDGIFACGDNISRNRTVANAVAMGTMAGMAVSKNIILEEFELVKK